MNPRIRQYEAHIINHNGHSAILIRDRLGLADRAVVVPRELAVLLALCDGTRDVATLMAAFELRTGLSLTRATVEHFLHQLDEAMLLDTPRAAAAQEQALESYRSASHRDPACAGRSYPADVTELRRLLDGYVAQVERTDITFNPAIRGLISPHIDFQRGWRTYASTWRLAQEALREAEVVLVLGTDHVGPDVSSLAEYVGKELTLTRQNYSTPYGVLPTAQDIVDALAEAIGPEAAFANELHHRNEHSIELALVWLQHFLEGRQCEIVPILCGSFQHFTDGLYDPAHHEPFRRLSASLRNALDGRRSMVVAAADLAHVGPAFGDGYAFGPAEKASLAEADASLLAAAASGDANAFLSPLVEERDRRRVCGLPPIYLALTLMAGVEGKLIDYMQCPADENNSSVVSICGMLFG